MINAQHFPVGAERRIEAADAGGAYAVKAAVLVPVQHELHGTPQGPSREGCGNHLITEQAAPVAAAEGVLVERDVRLLEPQSLGEHGQNQGLPLIAPMNMAVPRLIEMGEGVLRLEGEMQR